MTLTNIATDSAITAGDEVGAGNVSPLSTPGGSWLAQGFQAGRGIPARFLNYLFNQLIAQVNTDSATIATHTSSIATNTSNIATNTASIATNASTLSGVDTDLAVVEAKFSGGKLINSALALLDGGSVALAALLKFTYGTVTQWAAYESGGGTMTGTKQVIQVYNQLQTIDATASQTLHAFTVPDNSVATFEGVILARNQTTAEQGAYFLRTAVRRRAAGSATLISTANQLADEEQATWNGTNTVSGNDLRASVTGAASQTIDWLVVGRITVFTP